MKVAIGNDHIGIILKNSLDDYFKANRIDVVHFGTYTEERMNYPEVAFRLSESLLTDNFNSGLLFCGTGIGMSIAANKVAGIRAVVCSDKYSARMSREHNDANILCLGSRIVDTKKAILILDEWFNASYVGDRHQTRVDMINGYGK